MRTTLFALGLVLAACGRSDRSSIPAASDAPTVTTMSGPDQLALRFPRAGGVVRAFAYPALDSVVWRSSAKAPPLDRILAFDEDAGSVAAVDTKGAPVRIDLRLGGVSREARTKLNHLTSSDGSAVYGIGADGSIKEIKFSESAASKLVAAGGQAVVTAA